MSKRLVILGGGESGVGAALLAKQKGYHEAKIVTRFWIVTLLCVILSIVTLKLR